MIDEYARQVAWEVKVTIETIVSVYLDRVRWVEFTATVGTAAGLAAQAVAYLGHPELAKSTGLIVGAYVAFVYLRNPKIADWQPNPVAISSKENI
jgi:hypothetical protein